MPRCPLYFHRFSPQTHRCTGCDRWERGFAPKVETKNAKPRSECQVCERQQAVANGVMMHHGYQRPGFGYILGDCFGVNHKPFPATDALEKWMKWLVSQQANLEKALLELPAATFVMVRDHNTKAGYKTMQRPEAEADRRPYSRWDAALKSAEYRLQQDLRFVIQDQVRVAARIELGQSTAAKETK